MLLSTVNIKYKNGNFESLPISSVSDSRENVEAYKFDSPNGIDYGTVEYIDFLMNPSPINAGENGFYLISGTSSECRESSIGYFHTRENLIHENKLQHMPVFGIKTDSYCYVSITTGMQYDSFAVIEIKDGKYNFYLRFLLEGQTPYEKISFELHKLSGSDRTYSGMAREYRKYQLANGFRTIREKNDEELNFCAESMLVRIRHGWKPVPCSVFEQTPETEPPMHVACTFKQVIDVMRQYKAAGIEKADFSLVGWNIKGHDGRWPQILPVEESLGGEQGLKELISEAHRLGYKVTCHTNSTDAYSIAENFSKDDLVINADGEYYWRDAYWAGGKAYQLCPECSLRLAKETLPEVKGLGFAGTHYIDVITSVMPYTCHNKLHPLNKRQAVEKWNQLFTYAKELFGGISCENACDHTLKDCNFVLYVSFFNGDLPKYVDESVPFWQLVYHGIIVSNPYATTVNAAASGKEKLLKTIEYGGRPVIYYYSKFVNDGKNWISDNDFTADTPEEIAHTAELAAQEYKLFEPLTYLQYEFIEEHEKLGDKIYRTTYSDGTKITVDYNKLIFEITK